MSKTKQRTFSSKRRLKIKEAPSPKQVNAASDTMQATAEHTSVNEWAADRIKSLMDTNDALHRDTIVALNRVRAENEQLRASIAALGKVLTTTYGEW